jgi:hypothetical protein
MDESRKETSPPRHEPRGQSRVPLTINEILELDAALIEAFRSLRDVRGRYPAAKHIKFPPLPSVVSESIVIAAAGKLFGPGWQGKYGGAVCDVVLANQSGARKFVEVKATGEHAFQELKAKDLRADFLAWVRFGRRFHDGDGPITIAILECPGRYILSACRLDTVRLERIVGVREAISLHTFVSLADLLANS